MRLANIELWPILITLPALWLMLLLRYHRTRKRLEAFADSSLLPAINPGETTYNAKSWKRGAFLTATLGLLLLAALRPQWGFEWEESERQGIDIAVALDVSGSMMATDIRPNRLERSRREILDLLEVFQGDRLALIAFSGVAFVESPLTLDYATFRLFLKSLSPELIPIPGTNIEDALRKSLEALRIGAKKDRGQAIILITDGEDFEGDLSQVAKEAADSAIQIYVIGVGTTAGAPIPLDKGYKKDKDGNVVITKLNQEALSELATKTGGIFVTSISSDKDTKTIYENGIKAHLSKSTIEDVRAKRWNEFFQIPLLAALLLLLIPGVMTLFRNFMASRNAQAANIVLFLLLASFAPGIAQAQQSEEYGHDGKAAFTDGKFDAALENFQNGKKLKPEDRRFLTAEASTLYRLGKFEKAAELFLEASNLALEPIQSAKSLYNAANSLVQTGSYEEAIKLYELSLEKNPEDTEAKDNLEYVKNLLKEKEKKDTQQQQDDKKQDKQQQQNQQQKQKDKQQDKQNQQQKQKDKQQDKQQQQNQQQKQENKQQDKQQQQNPQQKQKNKQQDKQKGEQKEDKQSERDDSQEQKSKMQPNPSQKPQDNKDGEPEEKRKPEQGRDENRPSPGKSDKREQQQRAGKSEDMGSGGGKQKNEREESPQQSLNQLESLLGNIGENRIPLIEHRRQKAREELIRQNRPLPQKDW